MNVAPGNTDIVIRLKTNVYIRQREILYPPPCFI